MHLSLVLYDKIVIGEIVLTDKCVKTIAYFCKQNLYACRRKAGAVMDTITAIKERILHLCNERDISINKLATLSALPPSSVKNILYGRSVDPKILTIKKMCDGLDISLAEFFSTPEFDALEQEIR